MYLQKIPTVTKQLSITNYELPTMLYVHVPFCSSKCGYCAFHSVPNPGKDVVDYYFKKLEKDFIKEKEKIGCLNSVFIGGGTPGYLSESNLEKLFVLIKDNFSISEKADISIECNPESLTKEKIKIIEGFANRVSLGVQSFNETSRKILERVGDIKKVYEVIEIIRSSKINNLSCDLIYAIPGQSLKDFEKDVCTIIDLNILSHFSAYALTFEENSRISGLYSEKADLESVSAGMWELIPEIIGNTGFERYEISNYSLKGKECKHNVNIWFGGKYLGFGPTASSFDGNTRWTQRTFSEWIKDEPAIYDRISEEKRMSEIFIMGLRTVFGWEIKLENRLRTTDHRLKSVDHFKILGPYNNSYSATYSYVEKLKGKLLPLKNSGLLDITDFDGGGFKVIPTLKGLSFWNEIALQLV